MFPVFVSLAIAATGFRLRTSSGQVKHTPLTGSKLETTALARPNLISSRPAADDLHKIEVLGEGSDAVVWSCKDSSGKKVAVKKIKEVGPRDSEMTIPPADEVDRMRTLRDSPNNLKLLGYFVEDEPDDFGDDEPVHNLVMELAEGGTLSEFWQSATGDIGNIRWGDKVSGVSGVSGRHFIKHRLISMMAIDATSGLKGMHEKFLVHTDLKVNNVLAMSGDPACVQTGACRFSIADYGRSHSPAEIRELGYVWERYVEQDVKQLGCTLLEILVGQKPHIVRQHGTCFQSVTKRSDMIHALNNLDYIMQDFKQLLSDMVGDKVPAASEASARAAALSCMQDPRARQDGRGSKSKHWGCLRSVAGQASALVPRSLLSASKTRQKP